MQERATLQNLVYEHMNTISHLKSLVESSKHLVGSKTAEPSRTEHLSEQLLTVKDELDQKEIEVGVIRNSSSLHWTSVALENVINKNVSLF